MDPIDPADPVCADPPLLEPDLGLSETECSIIHVVIAT